MAWDEASNAALKNVRSRRRGSLWTNRIVEGSALLTATKRRSSSGRSSAGSMTTSALLFPIGASKPSNTTDARPTAGTSTDWRATCVPFSMSSVTVFSCLRCTKASHDRFEVSLSSAEDTRGSPHAFDRPIGRLRLSHVVYFEGRHCWKGNVGKASGHSRLLKVGEDVNRHGHVRIGRECTNGLGQVAVGVAR